MRIALIHCPFGHRVYSENLKVVDEEFCLAPPIVLAYVAAILESSGHKVIIIDANALKLSKKKVLAILKKFSPNVIGFRADSYWFHRVVEWASFIKNNIETKIIVGGINVTLYPRESLEYKCFDYGIVGEAINSLPKLIWSLENNREICSISGLVYRNNGEILVNPPDEHAVDFNLYPFPARHLLPNHLYHSFTSQRKNYSVMLTTTGCPYKCKFCAISRLPYRERLPKNIVDEIEECYTKYSIREIDFFDATFFINKQLFLEFCNEILRRKIDIEWSCRSRVDVVDEKILQRAYQAGCRKIYYGIETASPEILKNINKNTDANKISWAINLTRKHGIKTLGFFMVGNPGETKENIISSIELAKKLKLDYIQVCKVIAKPNTDFNDTLVAAYGVDYWKDYISGKRAEQRLPTPWSGLSELDLDKLTRKFYSDFYFRPIYILKRTYAVKSFNELARYIKTVLRWILCNDSH